MRMGKFTPQLYNTMTPINNITGITFRTICFQMMNALLANQNSSNCKELEHLKRQRTELQRALINKQHYRPLVWALI